MELDGATALVTGASTGLGAATARALTAAGASVVVTELPDRLPAAEDLAAELGGLALELDVREPVQVAERVAEAAAWRGRLDVAVNNAGIAIRRPALELTAADWDAVLDVNLRGAFLVAQAAARAMCQGEPTRGAIVNVASIMGLVGSPERAAYSASKGGLVNLTRTLALEWAELGIRVNAVCPSFADTPFTRPLFASRPDVLADVLARTPLGRLVAPEEVAEAVVFLARADMVTGTTLAVDGGWTAQ